MAGKTMEISVSPKMEAGMFLHKKYPHYFPPSRENIDILWERAYSVVAQTFILLEVGGTNAYAKTSFRQNVFVTTKPVEDQRRQIKLDRILFCFSLSDICPEPFIEFLSVEGNWDALDKPIKEAMTCLHKYLVEFEIVHKPCLKKMCEAIKPPPESHVQAVLACHLFAHLSSNSDLHIDQNTYDGKGCPWCSIKLSNVCKANTSFGHPQYWHGRGDMIIVHKEDNSTNVVTVASPEEIEVETVASPEKVEGESESIALEEPEEFEYTRKAMIQVKQTIPVNYNDLSNICLLRSRVFSQTITNGFLVCKQNKDLEDNLIPCFLVSHKHIAINMYNPKWDVLLTQGDYLEIIDQKGELKEELVFQLWLALNLNLFKQQIFRKSEQNMEFKSCGFLDSLSDEVKDIYRYHLSTNLAPQKAQSEYDKAVIDTAKSVRTLKERAAKKNPSRFHLI